MDSPYDLRSVLAPLHRAQSRARVPHLARAASAYRASPDQLCLQSSRRFRRAARNFFCRSLIFSGVTRRFPKLSFAFLEGGVSWALTLLTDIVEHWEKRNADALGRTSIPICSMSICWSGSSASSATSGSGPSASAPIRTARFQINRPALFDEFAACAPARHQGPEGALRRSVLFRLRGRGPHGGRRLRPQLSPVGLPLKADARLRHRPLGRARRHHHPRRGLSASCRRSF